MLLLLESVMLLLLVHQSPHLHGSCGNQITMEVGHMIAVEVATVGGQITVEVDAVVVADVVRLLVVLEV